MDIGYLNLLPEVENKYNVNLQDSEKVVFVVNLPVFGTEKGSMLGTDCDFTLTNKRIIINNHAGIWTINVADDIANCAKVQSGRFIFKSVYYSVTLNEEVVFDHGRQKLSGYRFYFDKEEIAQFDEIMDNVLK